MEVLPRRDWPTQSTRYVITRRRMIVTTTEQTVCSKYDTHSRSRVRSMCPCTAECRSMILLRAVPPTRMHCPGVLRILPHLGRLLRISPFVERFAVRTIRIPGCTCGEIPTSRAIFFLHTCQGALRCTTQSCLSPEHHGRVLVAITPSSPELHRSKHTVA
jgi:hypothetical protein